MNQSSRNQKETALPNPLNQVRKHFTHWRNTRPPRSKFSKTLWSEAIAMAKEYGPTRVAKALGLDYYSLKKHLSDTSSDHPENKNLTSSFIELIPPMQTECTIELEDSEGGKMRIFLKSDKVPDLISLSRSFWMGE